MRNYFFYGLIFFLALSCDMPSNIKQPDKSYLVKYFGGDGNQKAVGLIVNADGTFFILGNSRKSPADNQQVYLAQADAQGKLLWQTTYGDTEMDAKGFAVTNGFLVVVANKKSTTDNTEDVQLIRFALNGDMVKSTSLQIDVQLSPTPKNEWASSLTVLNDGGFLVTGYTDYVGANTDTHQYDAIHLRTDADFNQKTVGWMPTSGHGTHNYTTQGFQVSPDTIYVFGSSDGPNPPRKDFDFWDFSINSAGFPSGDDLNTVVNSSDEKLTHVIKANLGGYLASCVSIDLSGQSGSLKIIKTKSKLTFSPQDNNIENTFVGKSLGKGANHFATASNSGTGYFVLANTYNASGIGDMILIKLDVNLQESWNDPVTLGGDGDDSAAAVAELPDGHIIVLGTMELGNPAEQYKIVLMKLNSAGQLSE